MSRTDERRAAVLICYQRDVTGAPIEGLIGQGEGASVPDSMEPRELGTALTAPTSFTRGLVEGVEENLAELDRMIEDHAIDWHVERVAPLERAILRVALFEILHSPDVPGEVAIDEAVESAKHYCQARAPGFVNGILGAVMRELSQDNA